MTYYPSADMDRRIMEIMAEEIQSIKQVEGFFPNVIFQPLYEGAVRAGHDRGGNALGINADGPLTSELPTLSIPLFLTSRIGTLTVASFASLSFDSEVD